MILLYRKTIRPLYAYVSKRVGGDRGLAEDLVQEAWMRALDSWPRKGSRPFFGVFGGVSGRARVIRKS